MRPFAFWNRRPAQGRPRTKSWTWRCASAAARPSARRLASSATSATRGPPESWRRPPMYCTISSAKPSAACRCSEQGPMSNDTLLLGAVAYDPKVVLIWDGFQAYFEKQGLPFDYILYSNYERQVTAQFAGQIDVAWNSPLAWIQSECVAAATGRKAEAIVMRDT